MPQAIVFDFDGVIVDTEPLHYRAFIGVTQRLGVTFTYNEYLRRYIGYDDRDGFRAMLADHTDQQPDDKTISQLCEEKARVFEAILADGVGVIPGMLELIKTASEKMPVAIASGATTQDILPILAGLGLSQTFDPIVTADHVTRSKPDPTTYRLAVEGLAKRLPNLQPSGCLAIEDTPAGLESARRAGLKTLALTTTHPPEALHAANRIVQTVQGLSLDELAAWFDD